MKLVTLSLTHTHTHTQAHALYTQECKFIGPGGDDHVSVYCFLMIPCLQKKYQIIMNCVRLYSLQNLKVQWLPCLTSNYYLIGATAKLDQFFYIILACKLVYNLTIISTN